MFLLFLHDFNIRCFREIVRHFFCGESVTPEYFKSVTVLVAEMTGYAESIKTLRSSRHLMAFLQHFHGVIDEILRDFDAYKVDALGDVVIVCTVKKFTEQYL